MKTISLSGLVLVLATFFGMVQFGPPAAFARPDTNATSLTNSKVKKTKAHYHIRRLPGLTAPAHKKQSNAEREAKKKAKKAEKEAVNRQHFLGTIAKKNGHYVLTSGILTFKLNDQAQAKKYAGKKVNVTGKLDPYKNRINVQIIQSESA